MIKPDGDLWTCCCANEIRLTDIINESKLRGVGLSDVLRINEVYSDVLFCDAFAAKRLCFIFKFGSIIGWDFTLNERTAMRSSLRRYLVDPLPPTRVEEDDMNYIRADRRAIKQDTIHLVTDEIFERLAYSYAFAQSAKLSFFETEVDNTIDRTRKIPESLARTGTIEEKRPEISRRIGELFTSRFYINLHTDILDTPDIFWEFDEFSDHYSACRSFLEIPKRVDILNQRLDIIKDLYDMLNSELSIQHGHRLEWIVIWLICIEVVIEIVWNIILKDTLK
eukprot:Polyplicarium_translucidae@DN5377_c0_g1_i1.p1